MTNQTSPGIYIPQRQLILLLASIMITVSAAIIFSAIFVTNLVQGQVASALAAQPTTPPTGQAAAYQLPPVTLADTELPYGDPYVGCTTPASSWVPSSEAPNSSNTPANNPSGDSSAVPSNTYNNDYRTTSSTENIDNGTYYSHSFNQGSYNEVEGDLIQTNTNNNSSGDSVVPAPLNSSYSGDSGVVAAQSPTPQNESVAIILPSQPTIIGN